MSRILRPKQLVFIRHAESARNAVKKGAVYFADDDARATVRGVPDHQINITGLGHDQARQTGLYMCEHFRRPDYVYHSGYARTIQTMDDVLDAFSAKERAKIKIRMNPFIREREPGYAYDMTTTEAETAFPWLHEHWNTFGGFFAQPPGGESLADVLTRVYLFINMLIRDRSGDRVWVFTHGGTLRLLRFVLERWTYEQALRWPKGQSPKNCGITVYDYSKREKHLMLREYNTVAWK